MTNCKYIYLNLSGHAKNKLGHVLKIIEERWFKELHYLLSTCWVESNDHPPVRPHISSGVLALSTAAGISTTLYKPDEYGPKKAWTHFKGLLKNHYRWDLDVPEGVNEDEAIKILYNTFRNPLSHELGIITKDLEKPEIKIRNSLPFIDKFEEVNRRIMDETFPFGDPSIKKIDDEITFSPAGFYWGLRKMVEAMLKKDEDVDQLSERIKKKYTASSDNIHYRK